MAFHPQSRAANPYVGTSFATYASIIAGLVVVLVIFEQLGINSLWLGHVVIALPVLSYIAIGFFTRTVLADEFFASGRRVPAFYNGLGLAASAFGGIGFFALTGALFLIGFDGLAIGLGLVAGFLVMALLFVPYLRKYGAYTLPSFFGERFDSPLLKVAASVLLLVPSMLLLSAELRLSAEVVSQFTSLGFPLLVFASASVTVLTNVLGGVRSLTWTNAAQMIVVFFGLLAPLVILSVVHTTLPLPQLTYGSLFNDIVRVEKAGGIEAATPKPLSVALPGEATLPVRKPMLQLFGFVGRFDFLLLLFVVALGSAVMPATLLRVGNSFSVTQSRRSIGWGIVTLAILLMTLPAIAVFARYLLLDGVIGQPFDAMPAWYGDLVGAGMVQTQDRNSDGLLQLREIAILRNGVPLMLPIVGDLPFVLVGFMAAAGMAAALAAAGSQLVAIATSVSEDLIQGSTSYRLSGARRLLFARLTMIVATTMAGLVAVSFDFDILQMALWALSLSAGSFFVPLVLSIWWRDCTAKLTLASMLAGGATTLLIVLLGWFGISDTFLGISNLTAGIVGVAASLATASALRYLRRGSAPVADEVLDELRVPNGETVFDYKERLVSGRGF